MDCGGFFTDAEAERNFGLNSSKLRTAQRFGLAISSSQMVGSRYIRIWSEPSLASVFLAETVASHLSIPFQAACQVLAEAVWLFPEIISTTASAALGLVITNRTYTHLIAYGEKSSIGHLYSGVDGRMALRRDAHIPYQDTHDVKSRSVVWVSPLLEDFYKIGRMKVDTTAPSRL